MGESFGVVRVRGPHGSGHEVEVATFRSDGAYVDGRRPESVVFSSPRLDAERRDFTINGMFFDPVTGEVIDYVGGLDDLRDKVLRAIGDPSARFREDKLRLLRAVRFAARFGFTIEPATRDAIVAMAGQVPVVAGERIAQELRRMLVARDAGAGHGPDDGDAADGRGPASGRGDEGESSRASRSSPRGTCGTTPCWCSACSPASRASRWPSPPSCTTWASRRRGRVHHGRFSFHNHEQVGRAIADEIGRRLKLSNAERERPDLAGRVPPVPRRGEAAPRSQAQADAGHAGDRRAARPPSRRRPGLDGRHQPGRLLRVLPHRPALRPDQPAAALDRPRPRPPRSGPGAAFKTILDHVREAQLDRVLASKREALEWIDRKVASGELPAGDAPDGES